MSIVKSNVFTKDLTSFWVKLVGRDPHVGGWRLAEMLAIVVEG